MTSTPPDQRLRLPALAEYRLTAGQRLAVAFCDLTEFVMGCEVLPITPRTFSMLMAAQNSFVAGGQPQIGDVVDFIWFHSPNYVRTDRAGQPAIKRSAVRPFTRQLAQPWRKWLGWMKPQPQAMIMALAVCEIRALLDSTFACAGRGNSGPALACIEAQMIHGFAMGYQWPPERTRNTPLRQLFQLDRCLALSRGVEVRDDTESDMIAAHLMRRNAEANPERAAQEVSSV